MLKKSLCLVAALMICVSGAFVGCGGEADNTATTPPDAQLDPNAKVDKSTSATPPDDTPPPSGN